MIISSEEEVKPKREKVAVKGVQTRTIELTDNRTIVSFSGRVKSFNKIEVFAEVGGILQNANFKEGVMFASGETLISIESSELRNNLKAQKSNLLSQVSTLMGDIAIDFPNEQKTWEYFLNSIEVNKPLPELPEFKNQKFKIYISGKQILNTYFSIQSQQDRLSKYTISAPFNGAVSQVSVKKGTLIRAGQKIGEFLGTDVYDLETEFSLIDKKYVHLGDEVTLTSKDLDLKVSGRIYRINPVVNANSQMVTAYVKLSNPLLREGMFLTGYISGQQHQKSARINRKLITNNKVFVVENSKLVEREVKILSVENDVAVVEGLQEGEKILKHNLNGLYNGMSVTEL